MLSESRTDRCDRDLYALYASKNPTMHAMREHNSEKRLHTMHTETRIGVSVGLRGCKVYAVGDAYRLHTECIQVSTNT